MLYTADIALRLDCAAEGGEVVLTEEVCSRPGHRVQIQGPAHMPDEAPGERVSSNARIDQIAVTPPLRREARRELGVGYRDSGDRHLGPEETVEGALQLEDVEFSIVRQGYDLAHRVDTGIRAAGDDGLDRSTQKRGQRRLELALDRPLARLFGISAKPGSVRGRTGMQQ